MENYLELLKSTRLFEGFNSEEISTMIKCVSPVFAVYNKGQAIF